MGKAITLTLLALVLASLIFALPAAAHEGEEHETAAEGITHQFKNIDVVVAGIATVLVLVALAAHYKNRMSRREQKAVFVVLVVVVMGVTIYLLATTIILNMFSVSGGPVHWHADFEVWACGEKLHLEEPAGWENKVGTSVLHHHGDMRIHVEGVVVRLEDVSLGRFFESIGGSLSSEHITVPAHEGIAAYRNGDLCGAAPGTLRMFVNGIANDKFNDYVIAPYTTVPPGDYINITFGP